MRFTGTETYTYQLLRALSALDIPDPIRVYLNASAPPSAELPGEPRCIPFPRFWTHFRLSYEVTRHRPGVLFVPAHVVPLVHPRSVVTVHDLGYLHVPGAHPRRQRLMLDATTRWSTSVATKIIAISHATKRDLIVHYRIPESKIRVIHHGVSSAFKPAGALEVDRMRARFNLTDHYVLAVGSIQPRKNYGRLARAVASLNGKGHDLTLVVAGKRGWLADRVERDIAESGLGNRARLLGHVDDEVLPALYSGATVFCQPSLYEGFGLPVLEAMACGVPAVASETSSLPEVAGTGALLVDPMAPHAIASAIERTITDDRFRSTQIEHGFRQSARFTWRACAESTIDVLRSVRDG